MKIEHIKYGALYLSVFISFGTWAFFCYLFPETVQVADFIALIKTYLVSAGAAFLAIYQPPKDPPGSPAVSV